MFAVKSFVLVVFAVLGCSLFLACGSGTDQNVNNSSSSPRAGESGSASVSETASPTPVAGNNTKHDDASPKTVSFEPKEFSEARGAGTGELGTFEKWTIIYGSDQIAINADGKAKRITSTNVTTETDFSLPVKRSESIDNKVYFTKYNDDWIFLFVVNDGGSAGGVITRLDGKTLKEKWVANISGFNVSKGLQEKNFAYLGAIGFAGKIDLDTGKYVWKHDDFYRKYKETGAFNIFETPEIKEDKIVFTEKIEGGKDNTIIFDKNDGKVIEVNVN